MQGGELQSRESSEGRVILTVDHAEQHYRIDVLDGANLGEVLEIEAYLADHGFEIMPEDECPSVSIGDGGVRYWACHQFGVEFGAVDVRFALAIAGITVAGMLPLASKLLMVMV